MTQSMPKSRAQSRVFTIPFLIIFSFLSVSFEGQASNQMTLLEGDSFEERAAYALAAYGNVDPVVSQARFARCAVDKVLSDKLFAALFKSVTPILKAHNGLLEALVILKRANGDNPISYSPGWNAFKLEDCGGGVRVCHEALRWGQLKSLLGHLEKRLPTLQEQLAAAVPYHMEVKRAEVVESFTESVVALTEIIGGFEALSSGNPHGDADLDVPDVEDEIFEIEAQILELEKRQGTLIALLEKAQTWESLHVKTLASYEKHQEEMTEARAALDEYLADKDYNTRTGEDIEVLKDPTDIDDQKEMESMTEANGALVAALKAELKAAKAWQREHDAAKAKVDRSVTKVERERAVFETYMATDAVRDAENPIKSDATDEHELIALASVSEANAANAAVFKERLAEAKTWQREYKASHAAIVKIVASIAKARTSFDRYMSSAPSENDTVLDGIDDPRDATDVHDLEALAAIQEECVATLEALEERLAEAKAWTA